MTRSIKPTGWVLMGVGVLVLTAGAAAFRRAPSAPVAPPPAEVSVLTVAPETVAARYEYVGQAEASRSVEVRSQVTGRSEEHTSELQTPCNLVCRLLLE